MDSDTPEELPASIEELEDYLHTQALDPETALEVLARRYIEQDNVDMALLVLRHLVEEAEDFEETLNEAPHEYVYSRTILKKCAVLLGKARKYPEAESFLRELIRKEEGLFSEHDTHTRLVSSSLAFCLLKTEKFEEATSIYESLVEQCKETVGERDPETLEYTARYLESLFGCQVPAQAPLEAENCLELIQRIDSGDSYDTKEALLKIGSVLLNEGIYRLGHQIIHQVLARQVEMFGHEHQHTTKLMDCASNLMLRSIHRNMEKGNGPYCALISRSRWGEMKEILGDSHSETISALALLADVLWVAEKHEVVLSLFRKVFELSSHRFGDNHPETISAQDILRNRLSELGHPEASRIIGSGAAEQKDVEDDAEGDVDDNVEDDGDNDEHNPNKTKDKGNEYLCSCCHKLDPSFHLGRAQFYVILKPLSFPTSNQTTKELLSSQSCPLCRLVSKGLSDKLEVSLSQLNPSTRIRYQYVHPETSDRDNKDGFVSEQSLSTLVDVPLLEVSVQDRSECVWIYSVEPSDDVTERVEAISGVSFSLNEIPLSSHQSPMYLTDHSSVDSIIMKWQEQRIGELSTKLALLGERHGYLKGRLVGEFVDTELLKTWVRYCDCHHGAGCAPLDMNQDSHWRPKWLIDVRKGMLVPGHEGGPTVRYAALSYVWGGKEAFQVGAGAGSRI